MHAERYRDRGVGERGDIIKGSQILAFDRVVWREVRGGGRE